MARELLENAALDIYFSDMESIGNDYDIESELAMSSDYDLIKYICEYVYEILN